MSRGQESAKGEESGVKKGVLSAYELRKIDAYWRRVITLASGCVSA